MDVGIIVGTIAAIAAIILGIISTYYQKKSVDYKEKAIFPEKLDFHGVTIFRGRNKTLDFAAKMFNEAEEGDTIFGMCRNCGFSKEFWNSLERALRRGAQLQVIVSKDARIKNALNKFKALPNSTVKTSEIANMRVMGIRNKKGLVVLSPEDGGYITVHVEHDHTCKAFCEPLFDSYWSKADDIFEKASYFKKEKFKRLNPDEMPGKYDKRVFIGGNYDLMANLKEIFDCVKNEGFDPILAYHYDIPKEKIYDYDLRLLHNCKFAIFEETYPAGELMELGKTREYNTKTLILYQIRDETSDELPKQLSTMVKTYGIEEVYGYDTLKKMKGIISKWLRNQTT